MELTDAVKSRRSIRSYADRPILDSEIEQLLDLARHAPSSMNGQPWHFVIVKNHKTKKALAGIKNKFCPSEKQAYQADFLVKAPVVIVVCVDKAKSFGREVENGVLASSLILLGAASRELGSVYMSAYTTAEPKLSQEIRKELNIPEGIEPISILPMGYLNESAPPKGLCSLREIMHFEHF
jgi:nitroreductase